MAAEERNDSSTESQCESSLLSDLSVSSIHSLRSDSTHSSIPSYLIVKNQIEDVILTQRAAVDQLVKYNIEIQNASRDMLNITLLSQEEKIKHLEKTIVEDYVLKEAYDSLQTELEENYVSKDRFESLQTLLQNERKSHSETDGKLQEVLEKFNSCLLEIEKLELQLKEKTMAFTMAHGKLEQELLDTQTKYRQIEIFNQELTKVCETQEICLQEKEKKLLELELKNNQHISRFEKQARDSEVEKQQEAYLNQMFNPGMLKKKSK